MPPGSSSDSPARMPGPITASSGARLRRTEPRHVPTPPTGPAPMAEVMADVLGARRRQLLEHVVSGGPWQPFEQLHELVRLDRLEPGPGGGERERPAGGAGQ